MSMSTLDGVLDQFAYHPATPDAAKRYTILRTIAAEVATEVWDLIPDGPEKTTAMRHLQQFLMYANLSIALTTPVDMITPHVARVLPEDAAVDPPGSSVSTTPSSPTGSTASSPDLSGSTGSDASAAATSIPSGPGAAPSDLPQTVDDVSAEIRGSGY